MTTQCHAATLQRWNNSDAGFCAGEIQLRRLADELEDLAGRDHDSVHQLTIDDMTALARGEAPSGRPPRCLRPDRPVPDSRRTACRRVRRARRSSN